MSTFTYNILRIVVYIVCKVICYNCRQQSSATIVRCSVVGCAVPVARRNVQRRFTE